MDTSEIIISQYQAALEMLKETVEKCPDWIWDDTGDRARFWHVAYHTFCQRQVEERVPQVEIRWVGMQHP